MKVVLECFKSILPGSGVKINYGAGTTLKFVSTVNYNGYFPKSITIKNCAEDAEDMDALVGEYRGVKCHIHFPCEKHGEEYETVVIDSGRSGRDLFIGEQKHTHVIIKGDNNGN